jgi:hypothetical protein
MRKSFRVLISAATIAVALAGSVAFADIMAGQSTTGTSTDVRVTQLTLAEPSGSMVGDVLLANVSYNGGSPASITAPTGWTLIQRVDNDTNGGIASYWKVVGASEPLTYTWSITPQTHAAGGITRYSGVNPYSPTEVSSSSVGRGLTATAPSVTTTDNGDQVVALFADNTATSTAPLFSTTTGMTKEYDAQNTPYGPTSARRSSSGNRRADGIKRRYNQYHEAT